MALKRLLCPELPRLGNPTRLPPTEAGHALRVLRLRDGDTIECLNGKGRSAIARLQVRGEEVLLFLHEEYETDVRPVESEEVPICLEMAILKGDAMEWVVEKAVELGIKQLIPLATAHTVVQIDRKGPAAFQERWQKIADQALKQSGRLHRLNVATPLHLEERLTQLPSHAQSPRLWFDESLRARDSGLLPWLGKNPDWKELALLIGPEGGWSESERELLTRASGSATFRLGLGPLTLRAETAALYAMAVCTEASREAGRIATPEVST